MFLLIMPDSQRYPSYLILINYCKNNVVLPLAMFDSFDFSIVSVTRFAQVTFEENPQMKISRFKEENMDM